MTIEASLVSLTTQTTELLDTVVTAQLALESRIASAVLLSENASQVPLTQMATSLITTNTFFVNHLTGGHA
jgi:hypothetical protein